MGSCYFNDLICYLYGDLLRFWYNIGVKSLLSRTENSQSNRDTFATAICIAHARTPISSSKICFQHSTNRSSSDTTPSTKRKVHSATECLNSFWIMKYDYEIHELTTNLVNKNISNSELHMHTRFLWFESKGLVLHLIKQTKTQNLRPSYPTNELKHFWRLKILPEILQM